MLNFDSIQARLVAAFGEPVTYTPHNGTATAIRAIRTTDFVDNTISHTGTGPQMVTFDLASFNVPRPAKDDTITDATGVVWFVKQVPRLPVEGQWRLTVEQ